MKIEYTKVGDYYLPNLYYPEETRPIGCWGMLRKEYLKEHKSGTYTYLLLTARLDSYLADVNEQAQERFDLIEAQMRHAEGVTEDMKVQAPMEWVRRCNNIRHRAAEIIKDELIMEKPYIDMSVMLDDLEEAVRKVVYGPYALWGHSMGGKISYELEKRLEAAGYTAKCLFISGSRVPSIPEPNPIYHLPDEAFKRELGRFEGTPKEILENQELLDFFLPMLRADFTMDETYYDKAGVVLHTPISAFGGEKDGEADESAICEWGKYTDNDFDYRIFPGGHFYLRDYEDEVISEVERRLQGVKNGG